MKENKVTKISLSTFFLILAIIIIAIMAIFMYKFYNEKMEANKKSDELQTQVSNLNGTVNNLQGKLDTISNTINSNNSNITNNDDKANENKSSSTELSAENTIKDLFLAKLKVLDNNNSEKLLDFKVDKVEILNNNKDQTFTNLGYKENDILAYITYSVKPEDVNNSIWIAGNGKIQGDWIINKVSCECLRNGKLVDNEALNTGW